MLGRQLGQAQFDDLGDLVRGCGPWPCTASTTGAPRLTAIRALMRQLAGSGDVGVVAADDQHRVALVGYLVVPVDDVGDGAVGILVQLLVADADALVVGQTGGGVGQQQFQDVVARPRPGG